MIARKRIVTLMICLLTYVHAGRADTSANPSPNSPSEEWTTLGTFACAALAVGSIYWPPLLNAAAWCAAGVAGYAIQPPPPPAPVAGSPWTSGGGSTYCNPAIDPCGNAHHTSRPTTVTDEGHAFLCKYIGAACVR